MAQPQLKIAYYQQDIAWEDPLRNHRMVEEAFDPLAGKIDMMVVPETFNTGFSDNMAAMAEPQEGATLHFARRMAARHDALFVGTWTVRLEQGAVVNRLHWVYPDGDYDYYDKGHTFRMSSEACQLLRGRQRALFEWRGWHAKPAVCYDLRFPKWLRNDNLSYDLLLVCANWPGSRHEAWTTLLKARAIENLSYVLGCNRCGKDGVGGNYTGNSALIDYKGFPLAEAEAEAGGDQLVTVTLDKDKLDTFREHWPLYLDFD